MADEPRDGSDKNRDAPTVRDLKGPELSSDTLPDVVGLYVPPRPLPEVSSHRTLDLRSVRLSDQADPRRALTQRRLVSPVGPEAPPRRRLGPWLFVGAVALLAGGAWALFSRAPNGSAESRTEVRPTAAVKTATTAFASPVRSAPEPAASASSASAPNAPAIPTDVSVPSAETPPPASLTSKSARAKESSKKRKDPWLE